MKKRDPLIPLVDRKSATGLRTIFTPPDRQVKLPMEIKISGILWNGKEYFAIVNDEVIKAGEQLDTVIVKEIQDDGIVVEYGERDFTIPLRKETEK